jgi:hypothetical protein
MLKIASAVFSFMTIYHRNGRRCEGSSFYDAAVVGVSWVEGLLL